MFTLEIISGTLSPFGVCASKPWQSSARG